jgi:hypothetical protein
LAITDVIAQIDAEIAKLQQAKTLLSGMSTTTTAVAVKTTGRRGRPKGSKNAAKKVAVKTAPKAKRKLSPEGRKAIAEAMKRRWAEHRKATTK